MTLHLDLGEEVETRSHSCGCRFVRHRTGFLRVDACLSHSIADLVRELAKTREQIRYSLARLEPKPVPAPYRRTWWQRVRRWWWRVRTRSERG